MTENRGLYLQVDRIASFLIQTTDTSATSSTAVKHTTHSFRLGIILSLDKTTITTNITKQYMRMYL